MTMTTHRAHLLMAAALLVAALLAGCEAPPVATAQR